MVFADKQFHRLKEHCDGCQCDSHEQLYRKDAIHLTEESCLQQIGDTLSQIHCARNERLRQFPFDTHQRFTNEFKINIEL